MRRSSSVKIGSVIKGVSLQFKLKFNEAEINQIASRYEYTGNEEELVSRTLIWKGIPDRQN